MKPLKNLKKQGKLKKQQPVYKTPAQKIRDYFIKKYGKSKNIFIREKTFPDIQVPKVQRFFKKK